jgi:group I intron endonuclease
MVIYKITNLITNKIYVGKDELNSSTYMGSGKWIRRSINKHGIENFKKEIIETCKNPIHLTEREIYWIKKLDATNPKIGYNITDGGNGGNTYKYKTEEELNLIKKKISESGKGRDSWNAGTKGLYTYEDLYGKEKAEYLKKIKIEISSKRKHTEKTKTLMSEQRKGKGIGVRWINNGKETKQLLPNTELPSGWFFGRKIKHL